MRRRRSAFGTNIPSTQYARMRSLIVWRCDVAIMAALALQSLTGCVAPSLKRTTAAPALRGSWLMYQERPDHNAVIQRPGFSKRWAYDAGARINGSLTMVDGVLFFDTFDGKVIAIDAGNGFLRWRAAADNAIMSTPIIMNSYVYVGTGHNGDSHPSGTSFAYVGDGRNQQPIWSRPEGDHIIALDATTGVKRWSYRTAGEDMPSSAYDDGVLVFANGDAHAYALRTDTGEAIWRRDLGGISTMASATVAQNTVLVSICSGKEYRGSTIALDPRTGTIRWRSPFGDCDSSPTVAGGRVFVSGVDGNRTPIGFGGRAIIAALDLTNGSTRWTYRSAHSGVYTKLASNERAIAGTYADATYFQAIPTDDEVLAFDPPTGAVRWRLRTMGPVKMSPVVKADRLYVGDTVGMWYVVDARTGRIISTRAFSAPFSTSPPLLVGDTVFVVNGTKVYAFRV